MKMYVCPMHPNIRQKMPGNCSICGMTLIQEEANRSTSSYKQLIIIFALLFLVSIVISIQQFSLVTIITNFMISFFLIFAGFKLLDLSGFAQGYSTYDLLAQKIKLYAYIYPFIELFFGLAMILKFQSVPVLLGEILIMTFSGIGVVIKLAKHEKFQCACLGTFLHIPLTKITLIEDFGMAFLASILLVLK